MKRILSLLGVISLTSSIACGVVACKKNPNSENTEENGIYKDYLSTLSEYKGKIRDIINGQIRLVQNSWQIDSDQSKNNKFLNITVLEPILKELSPVEDSVQGKNGSYLLNQVFEKNNFLQESYFADLNTYLDFDLIRKQVIELSKDEKYNILTGGIDEDNLILINREKYGVSESNFKPVVNYVQDQLVEVKSIVYFELNYLGIDGVLSKNEENKYDFNYQIWTKTDVLGGLKKSLEELKYSLLINDDIEKSSIIQENDVTSNYDDLKNKFIDKFNKLSDQILEVYNKNVNASGYTFSWDKESKTPFNNFGDTTEEVWDYQAKPSSKKEYAWKDNNDLYKNLEANPELYDYIFKDISKSKDEDGVETSINNYIYNELPNWFNTYYSNIEFDANNDEIFKSIEDTDLKEKIIKKLKSTIDLKRVSVGSLKLNISGVETSINNLDILTGFSFDTNEDLSQINKENKNSKTALGLAKNVDKGLKSYKNVLGVRKPSDLKNNDFKDYRMFGFDGGKYNLWDTFDWNVIFRNGDFLIFLWGPFVEPLNRYLSLKADNNESQVNARKELLSEGNQTKFDIGFQTKESASGRGRIIKEDNVGDYWNNDYPGFIINDQGGGTGNWYNHWELSIDYLSVSFKIIENFTGDKYYYNIFANTAVIEKLNKKA
ncbi:hypothetical protein SGLAD_v1c04070 [Spiroplasma gladiatoris]|uniref:Lipoprotein n=1 Tax=Spiroplasma gladiatoris TaxID=2143 RepID=A0A4P7AIX2_9MOLU|nr:hypothetical protein [Spiroplasma gladiatoris]QBQ07606.1 hypothetical protein SGLAD_v1c04070 [Spiroplasma gladiatoris]